MAPDIVIVRSNAIVYSTRVTKIGISLTKRYSLLILGWNREKVSKQIIHNQVLDIKLFGLRAPLGKPSVIGYFPFFWIWLLGNLLWYRPKIVHACDLDTILPCLIYKMIFRKILIFDVCDRYAMARIDPKHKLIYNVVNFFEEAAAKNANALITVADKLLATFQSRPKNVGVIMNFSDDSYISRDVSKKENNEGEKFTLVYPGNIDRDRGLEQVSRAIMGLNDVELVIAGKPIDEKLLHRILKVPNVKYKGLLPRNDALVLTSRSDAMVILYDPQVPNNNFSASNKMFEAMMLGIPIITNVSSDIVNTEIGCGIMVSYGDVNQIREAILKLKENIKLRKQLGNNGRKAYLQRYNWSNMEKSLFKLYEDLLNPIIDKGR